MLICGFIFVVCIDARVCVSCIPSPVCANALFNRSMKGHVEGSICLSIPGTRALVIKMLVDLIWGTMETRGGEKIVFTSVYV